MNLSYRAQPPKMLFSLPIWAKDAVLDEVPSYRTRRYTKALVIKYAVYRFRMV